MKDIVVLHTQTRETADYWLKMGANVTTKFITDFIHLFPNSVQSNKLLNQPYSCAEEHESSTGT